MGEDFSLNVALPPVFALLAGLSIELLLKAIARLLEKEFKRIHRIGDLINNVGISLSCEHGGIAASLTEYVYWASRYPVPSEEDAYHKAQRIFREVGDVDLVKYDSLWKMLNVTYWKAKQLIYEP